MSEGPRLSLAREAVKREAGEGVNLKGKENWATLSEPRRTGDESGGLLRTESSFDRGCVSSSFFSLLDFCLSLLSVSGDAIEDT